MSAQEIDRERLRALAVAARDAFPGWDWPSARHMSVASLAYVIGADDLPPPDPTGDFCDAVTPEVLIALLDLLDEVQETSWRREDR